MINPLEEFKNAMNRPRLVVSKLVCKYDTSAGRIQTYHEQAYQ